MKELRGHIRSVLIGFIVLFLILGAYIEAAKGECKGWFYFGS